MPTPKEFKAPFLPECFYHIVCKSVDGINLFRDDADYHVFLQRFQQFTALIFDVWSYCLLTNHTHHIIKIKSSAGILENIKKQEDRTQAMKSFLSDQNNELFFDAMIERQMNSFLVSFANYTNNKYSRKGGLFQKPFRRVQIADDIHLQQAIIYVHANAQKHNIVRDFKDHAYNSYQATVNKKVASIDTKNVLDLFGGIEAFKSMHTNQVDYYYSNHWPSSKLE
jgi:REP element-mobilizing transposase RayT